jgi:hypothetical protein
MQLAVSSMREGSYGLTNLGQASWLVPGDWLFVDRICRRVETPPLLSNHRALNHKPPPLALAHFENSIATRLGGRPSNGRFTVVKENASAAPTRARDTLIR